MDLLAFDCIHYEKKTLEKVSKCLLIIKSENNLSNVQNTTLILAVSLLITYQGISWNRYR